MTSYHWHRYSVAESFERLLNGENPWYLGVKTENLRRFYAQTTPEVFKRHNVIGGDKLLSRV